MEWAKYGSGGGWEGGKVYEVNAEERIFSGGEYLADSSLTTKLLHIALKVKSDTRHSRCFYKWGKTLEAALDPIAEKVLVSCLYCIVWYIHMTWCIGKSLMLVLVKVAYVSLAKESTASPAAEEGFCWKVRISITSVTWEFAPVGVQPSSLLQKNITFFVQLFRDEKFSEHDS